MPQNVLCMFILGKAAGSVKGLRAETTAFQKSWLTGARIRRHSFHVGPLQSVYVMFSAYLALVTVRAAPPDCARECNHGRGCLEQAIAAIESSDNPSRSRRRDLVGVRDAEALRR